MKPAVDFIRDVNSQPDKDGVFFSRKAKIRCGLSKELIGVWHVKQLFPHLLIIVIMYRDNSDGKPVVGSLELDCAVTTTYDE